MRQTLSSVPVSSVTSARRGSQQEGVGAGPLSDLEGFDDADPEDLQYVGGDFAGANFSEADFSGASSRGRI